MKRLIIFTVIFVFCNIHLSFARINISIDQISPDTPPDVKEQILRLYSKDPVQRFLGAYELGKLGPNAAPAVEFLAGLLDDDAKLDQDHIFKQYYGIFYPRYAQAQPPTTPGEKAAWALVQIGPVSVQHLILALKNESPHARINAIAALQGLKCGVMDIAAMLTDDVMEVRLKAVEALHKFKDVKTVPILIDALNDPEKKVRRMIIIALGEIKDPRVILPLYNLTGAEDEEIRTSAIIQFAAFFNDQFARDLVRKGIESQDPRAFEVVVYGNWLTPTLVNLLIPLLKHDNPSIRAAAATALRYNYKDHRAVEPLLSLLNDDVQDVRDRAICSLAELRDPRAVEPLIDLFNKEPSILVAGAIGKLRDQRAVEPLLVTLKNKNADRRLRSAVAEALGNIKDTRAVKPLLDAYYEGDPWLSNRADLALTYIAGRYFRTTEECINWWQSQINYAK